MALDTLVARGNTGTGTDQLAGKNIPGVGWAAASLLIDPAGLEIDAGNPLPVNIAGLIAAIQAYTRAEDSPHTSGDLGVPMLGIRRDADTFTADDGDYTLLKMDEEGRLKVAVKPATYQLVQGDISAVGGTVAINTSRVSNIMLQLVTATAFAGHNVTFEGSLNSTDGVNGTWFGVQAVRSNANTIDLATGALSAVPGYGWECSVNGLNWFRVRATAHTSGVATWIIQPAPYATEPIPAAQVTAAQPVNATLVASTVRAGFVAAAGIWWDDSSTALAANATFTGSSRDLTGTATATAFANAATYAKEFRASVATDVAGTLWVSVSRDNVTWRRIKRQDTVQAAGGVHYAEIIHLTSWRYARAEFVNGAGAQSFFTLNSVAMGA